MAYSARSTAKSASRARTMRPSARLAKTKSKRAKKKKKMNDISVLEQKIGVTFNNKDLLKQALTHRSYLNENPNWPLDHNERLEFLGDAVLELAVTEHLYAKYPNPEGELTNWRAALVNANILSDIARTFGLNDHIFLSRGEAKDTGRARQ